MTSASARRSDGCGQRPRSSWRRSDRRGGPSRSQAEPHHARPDQRPQRSGKAATLGLEVPGITHRRVAIAEMRHAVGATDRLRTCMTTRDHGVETSRQPGEAPERAASAAGTTRGEREPRGRAAERTAPPPATGGPRSARRSSSRAARRETLSASPRRPARSRRTERATRGRLQRAPLNRNRRPAGPTIVSRCDGQVAAARARRRSGGHAHSRGCGLGRRHSARPCACLGQAPAQTLRILRSNPRYFTAGSVAPST